MMSIKSGLIQCTESDLSSICTDDISYAEIKNDIMGTILKDKEVQSCGHHNSQEAGSAGKQHLEAHVLNSSGSREKTTRRTAKGGH